MGKQFGKVKKTLAILLAAFFVMSLSAAAVSAAPYGGHDRDYDHDYDWYHHHYYHDYDWWYHHNHDYDHDYDRWFWHRHHGY